MKAFEFSLKKIIGTDLRYWYQYLYEYGFVCEMADTYKQKFGKVAEKVVEILTKSKKTAIRDFNEGEIKCVSLQEGGKEYLKDRKGNLLTYRLGPEEEYMILKPYGDNFIMPYNDSLTLRKFKIKVDNMYFIFYEKYQPEGPDYVEQAMVVNILNFKSEWYKNLENEFNLIKQVVDSVDIYDYELCTKAQSYVRESNSLLVIKRFENGGKFEWQVFFKDKEVIKYGEFLVDYKKIKSFDELYEGGDEALEYVYKLASNDDYKVMEKHFDDSINVYGNFLDEEKNEKVKEVKVTKKEKVKTPKKETKDSNIKIQSEIYKLACNLSSNELSEVISILSIVKHSK